ncbi:hypothetical protein BZA05DRAFT_454790 [Tricharina praecox]|uniref:uncharacterized protein n=1 Tax=Tricharina praecox TaxID=43433 RepID=UPI00221FC95F|nr:uncharacterized protein BZA05DRAFT_454790 [Tricharina praecox]KAI5849879.1 hypothetical protein BZA05DRAFT_454790 [Tricharina praecox]
MSEAAAAAAPHSERKPHAHHKQFVVSRHHHGNPRVPSFGRGLNKLGGGATATTTNTTTTTTTTEKGERGERGGEKGEKSRKKTAFELGSVGSENGGGDEDFEAAEGDGGRGGGGGEAPPITRTDSSGGHGKMQRTDSRTALQRNPSTAALTKSSSTRSLDREARRHRAVGAARKGTTLHERQRSKSGDRKKTTKLTPPPPPPPPPLPVDVEIELPPSPPPNDSTAIISHGGGGERPPTPPLTSRFTASPSSAASAHPLRRSDSAYSIAPASRTQQKLWLQRASVASPPATPTAANHHYHSHHIALPAALEKEFDRVAREYMNVRRFKNPLLEAIERVPRRGVPGPNKPLQQEGVTLGLSRSLQEGSGRKLMRGQGESGSRDDLGVSGAVPEAEMVLERMWRREGTIVSHE